LVWSTTLKFTPGQFREILSLSQDTFRHWKQALGPLSERNGYRPCFDPGDLLAVAVIKALVDDGGLRISALSPLAEQLFEACNAASWVALERSVFRFELGVGRLTVASETHPPSVSGTAIYVQLRPILADLRERLLMGQDAARQQSLRFPPAAVGERRSAGRDKP
jgi:hypothetical protein